MISNLKTNCSASWSTMIWLDIEGSQYWTGNTTSNKTWYQSLLNACDSTAGVTCGIYSSSVQWQAIFGSTSYCYGSTHQLWYAHYDNVASFSDFVPFACWTTAQLWGKQYKGDVTQCSMGIDVDYIPSQ